MGGDKCLLNNPFLQAIAERLVLFTNVGWGEASGGAWPFCSLSELVMIRSPEACWWALSPRWCRRTDGWQSQDRGLSNGELQLSLWRCSILMTQLLTGSSWTTDVPLSVWIGFYGRNWKRKVNASVVSWKPAAASQRRLLCVHSLVMWLFVAQSCPVMERHTLLLFWAAGLFSRLSPPGLAVRGMAQCLGRQTSPRHISWMWNRAPGSCQGGLQSMGRDGAPPPVQRDWKSPLRMSPRFITTSQDRWVFITNVSQLNFSQRFVLCR